MLIKFNWNSELKNCVPPPVQGNKKERKMNRDMERDRAGENLEKSGCSEIGV